MTVLFEVADGIALITLNRPERRNAIDLPTAEALSNALTEMDDRDDVVVGIITGNGPVFSAGMDLKVIATGGPRPIVPGRGAFGIVENPPAKPLIAAVEGPALAGGFEIALACDLIVAAENASFGLPEVKRGLAAAAGGAVRLPQRIPYSQAMRMILTGEPITAQRAYEFGLVIELTPPGGALTVAQELAAKIAVNAPLAVRTSKAVVNLVQGKSLEAAFEVQRPLMQMIRESADALEGAKAFAEKREPRWTGK
ncbi:crotonase/enoyl-CoA hydratase family protein [Sporichthya sp.]|uniref:crotonase/enoyl-CoA hydratase family protein n=1 Tax=Sporichthya sp. TaxID=65475 RepID=UPI001853D22E|nr:crotonase/enoyl-CoA hydratase family protein [Sporichthya sp.]MBA3742260.1 crotonase/enoyl-CoA hydratase family protein [Sporichthya sp.]